MDPRLPRRDRLEGRNTSTPTPEQYLANELARQIDRAAADLRDAALTLDILAHRVRTTTAGQYPFHAADAIKGGTATLANPPLSNFEQGAADAALARAEGQREDA